VIQDVSDSGKEMTHVGSKITPITTTPINHTTARGICAIRDEFGNVMGMCSRIMYEKEHCLVTACHVWLDMIKQSVRGKVFIEHGGVSSPIDVSTVEILSSSPQEQMDVVVIKVTVGFFEFLNVKKLKVGMVPDGAPVILFGYEPSMGLCSSIGTVLSHPDNFGILTHNASTIPGWSGTPLMYNNNLVGIHTGFENGKNVASSTFWEYVAMKESYVNLNKRQIVDELPSIPNIKVRKTHFKTRFYYHQVETVGKLAKITSWPLKDFKGSATWSREEDLEDYMDMHQNGGYEGADFLRGVQNHPPTALSNSSIASDSISGKKVSFAQTGLDSKKSVDVPPEDLEENLKPKISLSKKQKRKGKVYESGRIPPSTQQPSEEVSSSKPVDTRIIIAHITRKQEKLYNRICRTREFQQVLAQRTPEKALLLRKKLLAFVVSYTFPLTGNPLQDFLSAP
jgi:hypothetical protein